MNCQRNTNSTLPTQLPHKFSYIVAILGHNNFESPNTLLWIILSSNSAVLIDIITGVSPPHFDFFVFYVLCQC
jgi:hypothetical protein